MRGLKICLWIGAVVCIVSVAGVFMPNSVWESVAKTFGVESVPDDAVSEYMRRLVLATYGVIGVFLAILALKPMEYGVMIPFTGLAGIVLGVVCLVTGYKVCMPTLWYLGDALPCIVFGALVLVFWKKAKQPTVEILDMETTDTED